MILSFLSRTVLRRILDGLGFVHFCLLLRSYKTVGVFSVTGGEKLLQKSKDLRKINPKCQIQEPTVSSSWWLVS